MQPESPRASRRCHLHTPSLHYWVAQQASWAVLDPRPSAPPFTSASAFGVLAQHFTHKFPKPPVGSLRKGYSYLFYFWRGKRKFRIMKFLTQSPAGMRQK